MKLAYKKPDTFTPILVTLTVESQGELDMLATLANAAWVGDVTQRFFKATLPDEFYGIEGSNTDRTAEFQQALAEHLKQRHAL